MPAAVEAIGLSYAYGQGPGRQYIFRQLGFDLQAASSVAILGRSGSGKSTLLNLIAGLDRPERGAVHVDGVNITALSEAQRTRFRRRHIGVVFQFFNLIDTLNVRDNLRLPLELNGLAGAAGDARIDALLERVGLSGYARRFPEELSGGEQQRVAVARSLVHGPGLVLADEPTGSLDAQTGTRIIELLRELVLDQGGALLLVTHSREVARHAAELRVLDAGRLQPYREGMVW